MLMLAIERCDDVACPYRFRFALWMNRYDAAGPVRTACALHILESPAFLKLDCFKKWGRPIDTGEKQYPKRLIRARLSNSAQPGN